VGAAVLARVGELALLAGKDAPQGGQSGSLMTMLLPFVAIFVLFYFLLMRPQRREQARRQAMLAAVKKNDRVVTVGGIYGVVTNVHREADEVTIKVDETTNTKLRVTLGSLARVLGDEGAEEGGAK
jgi:preprotein translocase subunit YajC